MFQGEVPTGQTPKQAQEESQQTEHSPSRARRRRRSWTHSSISEFDFTKKNQGIVFNSPPFLSSPAPVSPSVSLNEGVDDEAELVPPTSGCKSGRWIRIAFRLANSSGSGVFRGLFPSERRKRRKGGKGELGKNKKDVENKRRDEVEAHQSSTSQPFNPIPIASPSLASTVLCR